MRCISRCFSPHPADQAAWKLTRPPLAKLVLSAVARACDMGLGRSTINRLIKSGSSSFKRLIASTAKTRSAALYHVVCSSPTITGQDYLRSRCMGFFARANPLGYAGRSKRPDDTTGVMRHATLNEAACGRSETIESASILPSKLSRGRNARA